MSSTKVTRIAWGIFIYMVFPFLLLIFFVPKGMGVTQVPERFCIGSLHVSDSQIGRVDMAPAIRIYSDDSDCHEFMYVDADKAKHHNFGDIIGALSPLLKYEICFNQETSIDDMTSPASKPVKFVLEDHTKFPLKLRFETQDSGVGDWVEQGHCAILGSKMQGVLKMYPDLRREEMSKELFEKLKEDKYLTESEELPGDFVGQFFEHTNITVKPRHMYWYVYFGLVAFCGFVFEFLQKRFSALFRDQGKE